MNIHHEKVIGVRLARKSVKNMTPFFHYQITMLKHFHEICFKKRKKTMFNYYFTSTGCILEQ